MDKDISTFGGAVRDARQRRFWSVRHVASLIQREDGKAIAPQYLNDIELERRCPTSDHMIHQFSTALEIDSDWLYYLANRIPQDIRLQQYSEQEFKEGIIAFRKATIGQRKLPL